MTTITRLKQLRDQLAGKLQPRRVERKRKEQLIADAIRECTAAVNSAITQTQTQTKTPTFLFEQFDRFASYREKIVPKLRESGYGYFLECDSKQYQEHQEWCNVSCQDHTLPHCDVWQVSCKYPRAFANKTDAALFRIMFEAVLIEGAK